MNTIRYCAFLALALNLLVGAAASAAEFKVLRDAGGRQIELRGELSLPPGPGPFAAVIVLHDCAGLWNRPDSALPDWAARLQAAGYATLVLDSFGPRSVNSVCTNTGQLISERIGDIFVAAHVLAGRPDIKPDKIGLIGFSHGGTMAMFAATDPLKPANVPLRERFMAVGKLAAAVSLYGGCNNTASRQVRTPLLMLLGENDNWVPPKGCQELAAAQAAGAPEVRVKVYPGAYHSFDRIGPGVRLDGHWLAHDSAATSDAHVQVREFFRQYLEEH